MNEREFRDRYAEFVDGATPSEELINRTLARTRAGASKRRRGLRRSYAIAACFVAGALLVGGVGYAAATSTGAIPSPFASSAAANGFTVRAWASNGGTILPAEEGGIVFDRTHAQWTETGNANTGYFTGCTFTVEGEGIVRVQASVSAGELYRQDITTISQASDPVAFNRAIDWDDCFRGLDGTLSSCDSVVVVKWDTEEGGALNGDEARNDQEIQAALLKRYGSVVDVSAADASGIDDGTTSFGLFNPSADGDPIALFDGATLTVTATFEDGSSSTQVITLHEAMFRVEPRYTDNPTYFTMTSEITSRDVDSTATETRGGTPIASSDGTYSIASVYGEVVSSSAEAFPNAGAAANEFADTLMPNSVDENVDLVDETTPLGKSASNMGILGASDTVAAQNIALSSDDYGNARVSLVDCESVVVHAPTVTFGGTPPLGRTKSEFAYQRSFMGDSAYADKWLEGRFGVSFNDDGTIATDGVTFATITIDVENTGNADEDFVANASGLASLVVVEEDGSVSDISRTSYKLVNEVDAPSRADDYEGTIYTAPANSHVTCVFAYTVPSHFATDGNVYVMVNGKLFPVGA